jgi:hypothetical protein
MSTPTHTRTTHPRRWFAVALITGILAVAVVHGPAAGMCALACFVTFLLGCVLALAGRDARGAERAGVFLGS